MIVQGIFIVYVLKKRGEIQCLTQTTSHCKNSDLIDILALKLVAHLSVLYSGYYDPFFVTQYI